MNENKKKLVEVILQEGKEYKTFLYYTDNILAFQKKLEKLAEHCDKEEFEQMLFDALKPPHIVFQFERTKHNRWGTLGVMFKNER